MAHRIGAVAVHRLRGRIRIVLVTTRGAGRWIMPKGRREDHLTDAEVAMLEAFEEAGVTGNIHPGRPVRVRNRGQTITLYLMQVSRVTKRWPEQRQRKRRLVEMAELHRWIGSKPMRQATERLVRRIDK